MVRPRWLICSACYLETIDVHLVRGVARQAGQAILNALHREEEAARSRHSQKFVRF